MNNAAQKVTRIDKDAWDIATEIKRCASNQNKKHS